MKKLLMSLLLVSAAGAQELRITAYDRANLQEEIARAAADEIQRTFRLARIRVAWSTGLPSADHAFLVVYKGRPGRGEEQEAACRARREIALQIVAEAPPGVNRAVLGISQPFAPAGLNVTVYNDRIRAAARARNQPHAIVLALVIAHEVGHVLLRSDIHSHSGLMSGLWTAQEFQRMAVRGLLFTDDQSARMRRTLAGTGCAAHQPLAGES
jgi:hypothetical protein